MSHRGPWWYALRKEDGLGLIEVMLAIFILGVALAALASVGLSSITSMRISRDREQATNAASAAIETARSRDFAALALAPGTVVSANLPPGSGTDTCFEGEPIVTDGAATDPIPFEVTAGNGDRITVHTLVTYQDGTCGSGVPTDLKRVTSIASWSDGGTLRTVRQETLVVAAARGLPVPEFTLRPPAASLEVSQAFLKDGEEPNKNRCVEHQLRNLGAEDSYEFAVRAVPAGVTPLSPFGNGYRAGDWLVTAYVEPSSVGVSRSGAPPADLTHLLRPASENEGRPYSNLRVDPGDVALFTVCYEPAPGTVDPGADTWPADLVATIAVHSRFDERKSETVIHDISLVDESAPGTPLLLFDPKDFEAHPRVRIAANGSLIYDPYPMGEQAPAGSDPSLVSNLGTIDYNDPTKSNWSTESSVHPGTHLAKASDGGSREVGPATLAWHHQFFSSKALLRDAKLLLWHAPTNALADTLSAEAQPVTLEIRIDGLQKNEKNVQWAGITTTVAYTHDPDGPVWARLEIPIDLGGEITFAADQYLRLRVTCAPSNTTDCNLAYDNVAYPSGLYVKVKS